ncbi:hypothetical protein JR316_0005090 [Psilocybe cubensis]|uniref:Uncharacterized protein n=2 Tax=Psilocybe cubensis TaxID=181762 RepID=A0ACB8H734_PSICU|nr:hypothetical protein JR316_0005090 [Psilocybe cubensis]KAH9482990.1 hypothetical protein JR316_0005090 [Psilocybe cubensis]
MATNTEDTAQSNLIDPSTFVFPQPLASTTVTIEFCDRVLHRATWVQTELFLTFPPPTIGSITLIPLNKDDTAGRFRVWLSTPDTDIAVLVWDRKLEGGFPELKVLVGAIYFREMCPFMGFLFRNNESEINFNQESLWDIPMFEKNGVVYIATDSIIENMCTFRTLSVKIYDQGPVSKWK